MLFRYVRGPEPRRTNEPVARFPRVPVIFHSSMMAVPAITSVALSRTPKVMLTVCPTICTLLLMPVTMWLRCADHSLRPVMKVFQPPFVALLVSMLSVFTSTSQLLAAPNAMPVVALANITSFPCIIISLCIYVVAITEST